MRIHDPTDGPLALAGLWTGRQDPETGEWRRTFTIVTTRPNEFMASIHDRMPGDRPDRMPGRDGWIRHRRTPASCGRSWSRATIIGLDAYPVPTLVNNVRNDGPALVERLQPPPDPPTLL